MAKNQKSRTGLLECIQDAGAAEGCSRAQGNLIYAVATKFPANALVHRCACEPFLSVPRPTSQQN